MSITMTDDELVEALYTEENEEAVAFAIARIASLKAERDEAVAAAIKAANLALRIAESTGIVQPGDVVFLTDLGEPDV